MCGIEITESCSVIQKDGNISGREVEGFYAQKALATCYRVPFMLGHLNSSYYFFSFFFSKTGFICVTVPAFTELAL